ncbi:ADP-ribosylglycohydrolase family protein [Alistipes senegalensis]|uniref:ADP-ribosylglycohydrolase family protein n=2 Tax=Alistipes senegalensis TaxID=1288121 RepID=A0ABY5V861_9BACT|nr:ADP-ribosylglycohydrolase family protein [Alistipes senegalensis]UEA87284.1 ADP-ribosylglycohydrolase family protein [Alistipes senegalensis]UWN65124.1 ADP-ribosylglycohydrolase family protein [Alistipes senegalensis JC50]
MNYSTLQKGIRETYNEAMERDKTINIDKEKITALRSWLEKYPEDADAYMALAKIYQRQGKYASASIEICNAFKYHTEDNLFPKSALYRFRAVELGGGYGGNEEDYNIAYQLAVKEVTDILHKRARMKRSLRWLYGRKSDDETLDRFDAYCQDYRLILKHDETDEQAMISLLSELIRKRKTRIYKGGLLGAIIGDIVGSRFEWNNHKSTIFNLFTPSNKFTDDTVMTIAIADWLLHGESLVDAMKDWAAKYPNRGYGSKFWQWLFIWRNKEPYNSYGNGSAMRVSPCGYFAQTLDEALDLAKQSAELTHNHPEGIKGAQAIAASVFLARQQIAKTEIRDYIESTFDYNLHRTCNEIRPIYEFNMTCQGSCPEAIIAFLESSDYESAIRLAVSLGGDSDTIACMTGGIAAAYYGIPDEIVYNAKEYLPDDILTIILEFDNHIR